MAADPSSLGEYEILDVALLDVPVTEYYMQRRAVPEKGAPVLIRCSRRVAVTTLDGQVIGYVPHRHYETILASPEAYRGVVTEAWVQDEPYVVVQLARIVG